MRANLIKGMLICVVCVFSFLTFICLYLKVFLGTLWGYPENLIGNYLTFEMLNYTFYAGVALFFLYWISKIITIGMETKTASE